jgi:succinate dehydrogenase/fumarate reductase flavoprotein subunit
MLFPNWKYKAIDLTEFARMFRENVPVEVGPAVEYFEGGVVVNERFETTLPGLYAAGECALGPFGANRVFAAITEMLVHGADAGENAAEYALAGSAPDVDEATVKRIEETAKAPLDRTEGTTPTGVRRAVQERAHKDLGPIRSGEELKSFIGYLEAVKSGQLPNLTATSKSKIYNKEWIAVLELGNMIHLLEAAARRALARTESRGVHYREDFPETDNDEWLQESIVKLDDAVFTVGHRPITTTAITPPSGKVPYLEMVKKMMAAHSDVGGHH